MALRAPFDPVFLPTVRHVLRDLNIYPIEAQLPVLDGVQYLDLSGSGIMEQINVLNRLKLEGVKYLSPPVERPPDAVETPFGPELYAIVPASAPDNKALTLSAKGANYVNGSAINFDGIPRSTEFIGFNDLACNLSKSDIPKGDSPVFVVNPDGATSEVLIFTST
jgi:hypothetical protein